MRDFEHVLRAAILSHFTKNDPKFHIDIVRANTACLAQMLRDRQLDALVVDIRLLRPAPDLRITSDR